MRPVSPVTWGAQHFFLRNSQSVIRTPWLRQRVHAPTSKSSSRPIAGTTGTVRLWSIITALVSTRPCEPWKVKDYLCRRKKTNIFMGHTLYNTFCRSACLLTAGGQEQHQFYRSEPHQQGAGPPVMMQQETCGDKSSVSPTPTTTASHNNNNNNSLSSGMSPLGGGNHSGDQSSVTKEERTSRQRGQSSPSPSKSAFLFP